MNKIYSVICFCSIFMLILSCEEPDYKSEIENAYSQAEQLIRYNNNSTDNLYWSSVSYDEMQWHKAKSYCDDLTEFGHTDWLLPTISELRSLIKDCAGSKSGGSCSVNDDCLSDSCWSSECYCEDKNSAYFSYSKLSDHVTLWSSSEHADDYRTVWVINFTNAKVGTHDKSWDTKYEDDPKGLYVRCVRYK